LMWFETRVALQFLAPSITTIMIMKSGSNGKTL